MYVLMTLIVFFFFVRASYVAAGTVVRILLATECLH